MYVYLRAVIDDGPLLEFSVNLYMTARACRVMNVLSFKSQRGYRAGPDDRRWVLGGNESWIREPNGDEYGVVGSSSMMVECHPRDTSEVLLSSVRRRTSVIVESEESVSEIDWWIHGSVGQYLTSIAVLQAVRSLAPARIDARLIAELHPSMMSNESLFFQLTTGRSLTSAIRLLSNRPIRGLLRPDFPLYGMVETSWP